MRRVLLPLSQAQTGQLDGTVALVEGSGCLVWHSVYETTGTAASAYRVYDGPSAGRQEIMGVRLSAGQSTRDWLGLHTVPFVNGLYFKTEAGSLSGSLTAWVDHTCETWYEFERALKELEVAAFTKYLGL